MNKKYNSKKNNKKYRKKTKIRGGATTPKSTVSASSVAGSSTSVKKEKLNIIGKRELNSLDNNRSLSIYGTPSELPKHQHYLLLALDLVYNGIMYCWTPSKRLRSVSGPTIDFYQIKKFSSPSGGGGSGKIELNICNPLNETACLENPICSYSKPKESCNLKDNFIICNKKCKNSKWYLLDLKDENNIKMLCICFCWGSNFSETEFNMIWNNGFRDNLLEVFNDNKYDVLMINGHSMGAGLAYLVTLEIFKDDEIKELILEKIVDFRNLYIHLFGMGRLPTKSVINFKKIYKKYKFNVYDIISYDETKNMFDSRIDNIKVNAADCDYLSNKKPPFYCLNFTKTKSRNKENAASYAFTKKELPSSFTPEERGDYGHCLTKSDWGKLYSPAWQKCQELMDKYHMHNTVKTYLIDNNGSLEIIDKNKISLTKEVVDIDPDTKEHPTGLLHSIKTYKNYFMEFLKSNNAI